MHTPVDMRDKILGISSILHSVITAAIPLVQSRVGNEDGFLASDEVIALEDIFESVRTTDSFINVLGKLDLDPASDKDVAIVLGAITTAWFVVASAAATGDDPEDIWQYYLSTN